MVRLDLNRINKNSPYFVISTNDSSCYKFVTDYNINYAVSFLEDELLLNCDSYQFIIANTNNKKSPRDPKLRLSIMAIIHEFFESTYVAIISRLDNPQLKEVVSEFTETMQLFSQKPT